MTEAAGDLIRLPGERNAHSAHLDAQGIQHETAFFAVQDLHPVPGCIDEHEHVSTANVHPHAVVHYAAQTVEPHTHVHRSVVQPVAHGVVKAEHCRLRLVPSDAPGSSRPGCASRYRCESEVRWSNRSPGSPRKLWMA